MATANHSRARKRPRSRSSPGLKGIRASQGTKVPEKRSLAASTSALDLRMSLYRLRGACATVTTVVAALRQQNVEHDTEFALVLQLAALDPLERDIEQLETLLGLCKEGNVC